MVPSMSLPGLSVIVAAFNERETLRSAVYDVLGALRQAGLTDAEIIIVDDGSTDGTASVADWLARHVPDVRVVHHPTNLGLAAVYETGLSLVQYDHVTWAPADREITYASLAAIYAATGSADLVVPYHGTPEKRTWFRRLLTFGSTTEINLLMGRCLRYWQGPVIYPTALASHLPRTERGFFCMAEMLTAAMTLGLSYVEVPLEHQERTYGTSTAVSWQRICSAQWAVLRFWWRLVVCRQRPAWSRERVPA
jgi:hypothetical protein